MDLPVDRLERLVTLIDSAAAPDGFYQDHILVGVGPTTLFMYRTSDHPIGVLAELDVPAEWEAIAVVAFGWAAQPRGLRPSEAPDRRRVRVTTLMHRDGSMCGTATLDDGLVIDMPGEGAVLDALREALGV